MPAEASKRLRGFTVHRARGQHDDDDARRPPARMSRSERGRSGPRGPAHPERRCSREVLLTARCCAARACAGPVRAAHAYGLCGGTCRGDRRPGAEAVIMRAATIARETLHAAWDRAAVIPTLLLQIMEARQSSAPLATCCHGSGPSLLTHGPVAQATAVGPSDGGCADSHAGGCADRTVAAVRERGAPPPRERYEVATQRRTQFVAAPRCRPGTAARSGAAGGQAPTADIASRPCSFSLVDPVALLSSGIWSTYVQPPPDHSRPRSRQEDVWAG